MGLSNSSLNGSVGDCYFQLSMADGADGRRGRRVDSLVALEDRTPETETAIIQPRATVESHAKEKPSMSDSLPTHPVVRNCTQSFKRAAIKSAYAYLC